MKISVVIPLLNESPNLRPLYDEITQAFEPLPHDYEIIFVDDGSTDDSLDILKALHEEDSHVGG